MELNRIELTLIILGMEALMEQLKDDGIGESLDDFIQFAIKIVLTSTNAAQAPKVKDLRAIALAY